MTAVATKTMTTAIADDTIAANTVGTLTTIAISMNTVGTITANTVGAITI